MNCRPKTLFSAMLVAFSFLWILSSPADAHARRGIMVINTGEDVMEIATLSGEAVQAMEVEGEPPAVGLMYSRFGIFFVDIARWDSKFVLYQDDGMDGFAYEDASIEDLQKLIAASSADPSAAVELKIPMSYYLPPGGVVIGLLLLLFVPFSIMSVLSDRKRRATLLSDSRYAAAVAQFNNDQSSEAVSLENAVAGLVEQGIPGTEATKNIVFLCDIDTDS